MNNQPQFISGALRDKRDRRDYRIAGVMAPVTIEKQVFNLEEKFPPNNQWSRGSCFHGDQEVLTENFRNRKIRDIRIGDTIFSDNGSLNKVTKIYRKKWQGVAYKISNFGVYKPLYCTSEHPILTNNGWKIAKKITEKDYLAIPVINTVKDKTIYSFEKDPDFLWVLGLFLAEGSFGEEKSVCFTLSHLEKEFAERVKSVMNNYGADVCYYITPSRPTCISVKIANKKWVEIFRELAGEYCHKKKIADRLMFLEPTLQLKIFKGWADGDGWTLKDGKHIGVTTTSKVLLWQMYNILLRNGLRGNMRKRKKIENKKQSYEFHYSFGDIDKYFSYNYRGYFKDNFYYSRVNNIEKIKGYTGSHVYNLEIEDKHTYIVNSIAVHNCTSQAQAHHKERQENENGSARFVMAKTKELEGNTEYGAYTRNSFRVVHTFGIPAETLYPEPDNTMTWEEYIDILKIPHACHVEAEKHKSKSYWSVNKDIDMVRQVLSESKKSVVISMAWYKEFNRPDNDGNIPMEYKDYAGGHAVNVVGFDDFKRYLRIENSWGRDWGNNGYFKMSYDRFNDLVWDLWTSQDYEDVLPVDGYYGRKRNWYAEWYMRFKNAWLHRKFINELKRNPLSITDRELKGLVYGAWDYEAIFKGRVGDKWLYATKY